MKVIIAGSRDITDENLLLSAIEESGFNITEVVSGNAKGVDLMGEMWAISKNIPRKDFPADWAKHPYSGGFLRNGKMAEYADALIAVWDGVSCGTRHMISCAAQRKLPTYVYNLKERSLLDFK